MTMIGKPGSQQPRVKKSETLEVRIPHETKQAFLNACREDGTTASEVVRDQVQSYLDAREQPPQQKKGTLVMQFSPNVRRYGPRVAAGSLAAFGLTALAVLPSAATPDFKAQFTRLDANGDGVRAGLQLARQIDVHLQRRATGPPEPPLAMSGCG